MAVVDDNTELALIAEYRERFFSEYRDGINSGKYAPEDVRRFQLCDWFALVFLRRYDHDLAVALPALSTAFKWRADNKISHLSVSSLRGPLSKGALYLHGTNVDGQKIIWFLGRRHKKDAVASQEARQLLAYWLERWFVEAKARDVDQRVIILLDMSGCGLQHMDFDFIRYLIDCVKFYFPMSMAGWKVIRSWLEPSAQKLIVFVSKSTIQSYVDLSNLPERMGGTDRYEYDISEEEDGSPQDAYDMESLDSVPANLNQLAYSGYDAHNTVGEGDSKRTRSVKFAEAEEHRSPACVNGYSSYANEYSEGLNNGGGGQSGVTAALTNQKGGPVLTNENGGGPVVIGHTSTGTGMEEGYVQERRRSRDKEPSQSGGMISKALSQKAKELIEERRLRVQLFPPGPSATVCPQSEMTFVTVPGDSEFVDVIAVRNPRVSEFVVYKVKTTGPEKFRVRPSAGLLHPGEVGVIKVYLQGAYVSTVHRDKFLLVTAVLSPSEAASLDGVDLSVWWKKGAVKLPTSQLHETKLRCNVKIPDGHGPQGEGGGALYGTDRELVLDAQVSQLKQALSDMQAEQRLTKLCLIAILLAVVGYWLYGFFFVPTPR